MTIVGIRYTLRVYEYNIIAYKNRGRYKKGGAKTASDLGLSLSAVTKALLKEFVRSKRLAVGGSERPEMPNARLRKSLQQSEEDIKAGRTIKFKDVNEAIAYIDALIADDKRKTKGKN